MNLQLDSERFAYSTWETTADLALQSAKRDPQIDIRHEPLQELKTFFSLFLGNHLPVGMTGLLA